MPTSWREPNAARWVGVRPAHNGEQIALEVAATNAIVIVYTVPAGKVLYLVEAMLWSLNNSGIKKLYIRDAADAMWRHLCYIVALSAAGVPNADHWNAWPPLEVPAGYDVCVSGSAAGITGNGAIFGWVE